VKTQDTRVNVEGIESHQAANSLAAAFRQVLGRVDAMPSVATSVMDRHNHTHPLSDDAWWHVVETFGKFGGDVNLVQQMSYGTLVLDEERDAFEAALGRPITRANEINNSLPRSPAYVIGDPFPAHYKAEYYPLVLAYPERIAWVKYSDFMHRSPSRSAAMFRTMETFKVVASAPVDTVSGWAIGFHQGVHSAVPNRTHGGFVAATVSLNAFSVLFDNSLPDQEKYFVRLTDITDGADLRLHDSVPASLHTTELASQEQLVAERLWKATVFLKSEAISQQVDDSVQAWWFWLAGTCVAVAFGVFTTVLMQQVRVRLISQAYAVKASTAADTHSTMLRLMNHGEWCFSVLLLACVDAASPLSGVLFCANRAPKPPDGPVVLPGYCFN